MTRERDDTGQYVETVGLEDVTDVFEAVDGPAITSSDVAQALDCTTEAARQKLTRLYDRGVVDKRKSGRTVIYWRTDDGHETPVTPDAGVDGHPAEQPAMAEPASGRRDEPVGERGDVRSLEARIETVDVPGSGSKADARRDAVRAAVEYIRERGEATPSDLREDVYPDHPGEYASGQSWWKNCVYPAIRELAKDDDRLEKADTTGRWSWDA